ncbi:hypothetical protein PSU4_10810 [Pseudonocardia sulfidoxydans NBRC 16205]|uniref:DUF998 domain-containing protein n=1 Tax=Pseudonocardia sulfidoxydans NBRC 16205 TaxID=1223511 RepID=A0A511DC32_9PSEU|nr:DUF998 domain-containing protein [Pseudonocardia sulfidoxydans]GEL22127.1 hypothetical protein PSU4_10810 [Pseudonocardia sulfidoxydans NBRC 16205]
MTEQSAGGQPGGDGVVRALAALGGIGVAAAILLVGALHVVAADRVDPVRRTISEYALGADAWMFDVGVVALALGSVAVILALTRADVLRPRSGATVLLGIWAVGMLTVVVFEKTNWSIGPSLGGYIHRYASLVAFLALPLGALLLARAQRGVPGVLAHRVWTRVLALASLGWFLPILWGFAMRPVTGRSWWNAVPLGLVERGLALTEVLLVAVLALWAAHAAGSRSRTPAPGLPAPARA